MKQNVIKSEAEIELIENNSVDQGNNDLWRKERQIRLTNFGKVMERRPKDVSNAVVKNMLYNKFKGNIHTVRGLVQEATTIIQHNNQKPNVEVKELDYVYVQSIIFWLPRQMV